MDPVSRRRLLQAGLAVPFLPSLLGRRAVSAVVAAPAIHPRADWGAELPPRGPMEPEQPGDVRFLLVHHSVSANDYPAAVPEELRSFHRLHTAPEKGWADIAYNFLVDRFGGIWEGRAGSVEAPVKGDATGGSQGFALLCCFIGDHRSAPPSPEAQASMVSLLAWLAERYGIDPRPGATASFVSRGSNRWPAGTSVTTATIAGHRDMSRTACPGDAAYHLVREDFPGRVAAAPGSAVVTMPPTANPSTTVTAATRSMAEATTTSALPPVTSTTASTASASTSASSRAAAPHPGGGDDTWWTGPLAGATGLLASAAVALGARVWRRRRLSGRADWPLGGNPHAQKENAGSSNDT